MKTHRHSWNYNLIGCESHLCEDLGRVGVNVLCPTLHLSPKPGDCTRTTIHAIPQPLLLSLRENRLCSRPIKHAWEGGISSFKTDTFLDLLDKMCATKAEYDEHGKNICRENLTRNVMDIHIAQDWCYNYAPWRVKAKTVKGYEEAVFVGLCLLGDQGFMRDIWPTMCVWRLS